MYKTLSTGTVQPRRNNKVYNRLLLTPSKKVFFLSGEFTDKVGFHLDESGLCEIEMPDSFS